MTRIAMLTTLWRRPAIAARVLAYHARVAPDSWMLFATRSPEDPEPMALDHDLLRWEFLSAPNRPLGAKHNVGLRAAEDAGCTHAVVLGSCNFLNSAYLDAVERRIAEGVDHGGCTDAIVYERDEATGERVGNEWWWKGYPRPPASEPPVIGTGRWFPLRRAAWPPERESGLDTALTRELELAGVKRPRGYTMEDMGGEGSLVLTRGEVQITDSATYGARA